jgi:hypothetical protein
MYYTNIVNELEGFGKVEADFFCNDCKEPMNGFHQTGVSWSSPTSLEADGFCVCGECGSDSKLTCEMCNEVIETVAFIGTGANDGCCLCEVCHALDSEVA